jgi:hypothetical protein
MSRMQFYFQGRLPYIFVGQPVISSKTFIDMMCTKGPVPPLSHINMYIVDNPTHQPM